MLLAGVAPRSWTKRLGHTKVNDDARYLLVHPPSLQSDATLAIERYLTRR